MNSVPLWIINPSQHQFNIRSKMEHAQIRSQVQRARWFRNTSYTSNQRSLSKDQSRTNRILQSIMTNSINILVDNYKKAIQDLEEVPNIRIKMAEEESSQKAKTSFIETNMDKLLKQSMVRNTVIQKQHECYSEMHRLVTQSHNNDKQKQQSIFIKSISTNIQSSCKIDSNKNSTRLFKTLKPPQAITNKQKIFYSTQKKCQNPEEPDRQNQYNPKNHKQTNNSYWSYKFKTRQQERDKQRMSENKHSLQIKPPRNSQVSAPHEQIIFKSRKVKQYASKVLEGKKIELDLQEQSLIKLIQNKIQNDYFGLILTNKSVYKKRMRTFYKA